MARISVLFDGRLSVGGSPLLMHNERLADPLDPYSEWLAELTGKTKKTKRDHQEIARREFLGAGYWSSDDGPEDQESGLPFIPTWNVIRCLQAAATRYKLGKHVIRALVPVTDETPLIYEGPETTRELWEAGPEFRSRKGVAVGQRRVIRTRPSFTDWRVEAELELDLTMLDINKVDMIAASAGRFEGLGDARPRYGRFLGSAVMLDEFTFETTDQADLERDLAAQQSARNTIRAADLDHLSRHPNGKKVRAGTT